MKLYAQELKRQADKLAKDVKKFSVNPLTDELTGKVEPDEELSVAESEVLKIKAIFLQGIEEQMNELDLDELLCEIELWDEEEAQRLRTEFKIERIEYDNIDDSKEYKRNVEGAIIT